MAWLFARSVGSEFLLRFEDLDSDFVRPEYYDAQRRDLERLGLSWDGELRQSEHLERYRAALDSLVSQGLTYRCYCSRREIRQAAAAPHVDLPDGVYPGTCAHLTAAQEQAHIADGRPAAIRLRSVGGVARFEDRLLGTVEAHLDDIVLARRDGTPAYNLVVVVDDAFQHVEEVVRGDDLAPSTPRQLHLGALLGVHAPAFAHVPLVLNATGDRLAKRDGAVTLDDRLALGQSSAEVLGILAVSLNVIEADLSAGPMPTPSADELLGVFDPAVLPREPWRFDPNEVAGGS